MDHIKTAATELYPLIVVQLSSSSKKYGSRTLEQLDEWRCSELPSLVKQRHNDHDTTWLTKDELVLLMDWKLAKGKFRPTLPKLIRSNDPDTVESVTKSGLLQMVSYLLESDTLNQKEYLQQVKKSIKIISQLKGVGPATASLILSLLVQIHPKSPPFFSDESFLYFVEPNDKIKYNIKEYTDMLLPLYFGLIDDDKTPFDTLEKGAWAIKTYDLKRDFELADINYNIENCAKFKPPIDNNKRKSKDTDNNTQSTTKKRRKG
ncbi:uncharacterized protein KQ657_004436 [Scheffersomyces spartinae]|uniref:Uncharacterized protein n=1 Tax=Scheffersomyces spartinae TaxID=45513 RepID=A0A9P7VB12_9ASCO|nr:uncharacterized protein KQ657_004436 [Scheffersomyces spartinae]KAG7194756.1 hypothetical protein KQ657_004436 [Scheffersomyces spartinae]